MAKLDHNSVAAVMLHAVRCPSVASQLEATGVVGQDFLDTPYSHFAMPVDALLEYRRASRDVPSHLVMEQLCARIAYNNSIVRPHIPAVRNFLGFVYRTQQEMLRPEFILAPGGLLQQVVDDVKTGPALRRLALETDPVKRNQAFADVKLEYGRTRVTTAQHTDIFDPATATKLTELSGRRYTGVSFIDEAVGGIEQVALEGLIAGTGGGKTMFGTMRACESVIRKRNTLMLQYEQTLTGDVVERFYGYVGGASRDQLQGGYAQYPEAVRDRIEKARPLFNQHFRMFGMAGDVPNQGSGGVQEIDTLIRRLVERDGWRPELVIIDWLEPLWSAWDVGRPKNSRSKTEEYKYLIAKMKELRDVWATNILLLHQIAPHHMERLTPAMKPDKTMAEEVKSFPNLMNYCYCFGKKDPETGCMWFVVSKARSAGNPSRIVRMDAMWNRIHDADRQYELNQGYSIEGGSVFVKKGREKDGAA